MDFHKESIIHRTFVSFLQFNDNACFFTSQQNSTQKYQTAPKNCSIDKNYINYSETKKQPQ